ncbi:GntR family transcriptional regulator [Bacillus sp. Bva_UNVM-123]|uniref:GntR family transcriptional regulator n=1 Tax=Bacillus sp. Bva_UNVM-123 TaxID=2829798 RepID=UPI00391EE398
MYINLTKDSHQRMNWQNQYKIPRIVVRKAYEQLQERGLVYAKQGKGSYVQARKQQIPLILTGNVSFTEKMKELNFRLVTKNIFCKQIHYDQRIFQALQASENEPVFKIGRLRILDDCPIAFHTSYVSQSNFPHIETEGHSITSIFEFYKNKGYESFASTESHLSVLFPSEYERELLNCSSLIPLLQIEAGCMDKRTGTILEYSRILYRSDRFMYVI